MRVLKSIGKFLFAIIALQLVTFYTFGKRTIITHAGNNFESYVLDFKSNKFEHIGFLTTLNPSREKVLERFPAFSPYELTLCTNGDPCEYLKEIDGYYAYLLDLETQKPFYYNILKEGEMAEGYLSGWESKHIWVFYRWFLIEKNNTMIGG